MNAQLSSSPRPSIEQLTRTVTETNAWVHESCSEIWALAQLALACVNAPEDYRRPEAMAHALRTIRDAAESLANYVQTEARAVNCDHP